MKQYWPRHDSNDKSLDTYLMVRMESLETSIHIWNLDIYERLHGEKFSDSVMECSTTGKRVKLDPYIILYTKIN